MPYRRVILLPLGGEAESRASTLGLYLEVTPKLFVSAGYAFGNAGVADGNHDLVLALSWQAK